MSIDLFKVYTIRQVIGTVQGTLTPWFRSISSEGRYPSGLCSGDPYPLGTPSDHYP